MYTEKKQLAKNNQGNFDKVRRFALPDIRLIIIWGYNSVPLCMNLLFHPSRDRASYPSFWIYATLTSMIVKCGGSNVLRLRRLVSKRSNSFCLFPLRALATMAKVYSTLLERENMKRPWRTNIMWTPRPHAGALEHQTSSPSCYHMTASEWENPKETNRELPHLSQPKESWNNKMVVMLGHWVLRCSKANRKLLIKTVWYCQRDRPWITKDRQIMDIHIWTLIDDWLDLINHW